MCLDRKKLIDEIVFDTHKETPNGVDGYLCRPSANSLVSVGWVSMHIADESPALSITVVLQKSVGCGVDLDCMVTRVLNLCGLAPDETYHARLYLVDGDCVQYSNRRSNSRQMDPLM